MSEEDQTVDFPWIQACALLALFILGALMEHFNWFPGL